MVTQQRRSPDVVVIGSAARDVDPDDPRGWRMGGGVTYGALACARLGIRTGALVGVDPPAAAAWELDLLQDAGVELVRVPLGMAPVFHNHERPEGRIQEFLGGTETLPVSALPEAWRAAPAWILAPVAGELDDAWASQASITTCVAFAWQGMLRRLVAGERVVPLPPGPSPLLARADIVGVSLHDLEHGPAWGAILGWLRPEAEVLLTAGRRGGMLLHRGTDGGVAGRRYPILPAQAELDATGAGDATLAAFVCARIAAREWAADRGLDLRLAAAVGSLIVEGPGLDAVPRIGPVRVRFTSGGST